MTADQLVLRLVEGSILEGPFFAEAVRVLSAKVRGNRIEVKATGVNTRQFYEKLLRAEDFDGTIRVIQTGQAAALDGDPTRFRLAAEAHRIRLAYQHDPHFAVSVSQVDPLPHQLDAVYNHLLTQPRIRFLIADDPGAGKTIMGGLLLKELKFRGLVERTLIVTPASLTDQWRRELQDKFHETFGVVNRHTINAAYGRNAWEDSAQCITSVDFVARQEDILDQMRDVHWDLVIVDEAHKMSAYKYGTKVETTQRYDLGEFLRDHTDHYLFLTATPHKGDPENFTLLLKLLDPDLYATGKILGEASRHDENRIMIRRLKEDMRQFDGSPCFPPRHVRTLPYRLTKPELRLYEEVTRYVQHNFDRADREGNRNVGLALTVLQRRLASSLAAIQLSLERRLKRLQDLRRLGKLKQEYGDVPSDLEDLAETDRWKFEDEMVERLTMAETMAELEAEIDDLKGLVALAKQTRRDAPETKFEELRKVLSEHISGRNERLLIFTEHKDTLDFLVEKLGDLGFQCCQIHGGMPLPKRIDAEREFFERCPSIMVATEAAGEGINLQFCSLMVNYDLPWNPNRLEQRMGRIHRYKQKNEVMIFNDVAENTREGEVMDLVLRKLKAMRDALGSDRVYDVIGEIIPAPRFDALMRDWLARRRTMTEILAEIDLQTDDRQVARMRAEMEDKALGTRHIDMTRLNAEVRESRERRLMPEYIERFFVEAYRSFGGTIAEVRGGKGLWSIGRVPPDLRKLPEAKERVHGKVGQSYPRLTFNKELLSDYSNLDFVGPGHPLFEGVVERVLREYGPALRQGTVFYDADATEPTLLWLVKGGVEDGRGTKVGERLFAVHRTAGRYRKSQPYALLDLKAPESPPSPPDDLRREAADEDALVEWSLDEVVTPYFAEVQGRRRRELEIKRKYVRKSLQYLISESNKKLQKYDAQLRQLPLLDDPGRLPIQGNRAREEARRNELMQRLDDRLAEIERERHLSETPPEVLGVALVLPMPERATDGTAGMRSDPEVERIAVEVSKRHEVEQGRLPVSVEGENCGWDLTSLRGGEVDRYIEVKGRAGVGDVALTPNEWIKAQRFGDQYWLYVVTNCKSKPELHLIRNPATKLTPKEEVSVVRYMIGVEDWRRVALGGAGAG